MHNTDNMQDCCRTGFQWNGTPVGREDKLGDRDAYVSGDNSSRAILLCHDAFGWRLNNTRLLADHFAKEVGATVYMPDFFHGDSVDQENIKMVPDGDAYKLEIKGDFDLGAWFSRNGPDVRLPEVLACARRLREQYSWIGAVGYCWGGSVCFKLASKANSGLFDCITIAHPGTPTEEDVRQINVPVQIIAPEHDFSFTPEWKEFCNKEIPKLGVDYAYQHFPGIYHGFATKCDDTKESEKKALELAKNAVVYWFKAHSK